MTPAPSYEGTKCWLHYNFVINWDFEILYLPEIHYLLSMRWNIEDSWFIHPKLDFNILD